MLTCGNQVSAVSSGYATGRRIWDSIRERSKRFFSTSERPDQLCGSHSLLCSGYRGSITGVKRPGREVYHSSLTSAEVKYEWSCTCDPPIYAFLAWTRKATFCLLVMCIALHSSMCFRVHCPVRDIEQVLFFIWCIFLTIIYFVVILSHGFLIAFSSAQNRAGLNGMRW
jgi:hypothetical protein